MSDDVTNLADFLRAEGDGDIWESFGRRNAEIVARAILASDWLAQRDGTNRLIGAATANTDAIAAYAELVEQVEALAGEWQQDGGAEPFAWDRLRALIDPEATP